MSKKHRITGPAFLGSLDPYEEEAVQYHSLGQIGFAENGDVYRYTRIISSGTDLVAGQLQVSLGKESNHANVALSAAVAVGGSTAAPTVGGTAVDANEYDEGWLIFNDVSPEGELYKVERHDTSASGSEAVNIYLERGLKTAATTSSEVTLVRTPWNNPAVSQLIAERSAGVAIQDWDVSVANFGWLKTRGMASVLTDATGVTTGYVAGISNETNGALGVVTANDLYDEYVPIAQAMATGTNGEYNPYYLYID
jgi:hypothetical protein